jgi:tetratricopeptide (TPR) repeat protein
MATEQRPPQAPTARTPPPPGLAHHTQPPHHTQPHDEALADYDRAIGLDPDNILALAARGDTYLKLKQYDEALADYNRAIGLDPGYFWAVRSRGEAYKLTRQYDEALAGFNRAID